MILSQTSFEFIPSSVYKMDGCISTNCCINELQTAVMDKLISAPILFLNQAIVFLQSKATADNCNGVDRLVQWCCQSLREGR